MMRFRFKTSADDPRPVRFPPPHPYWVTGYAFDPDRSIVVAYADDEDQLREFWPDAEDVVGEARDGYTFTDRFAKPDWFE